MPNIKWTPLVISIVIALVFFALGRMIMVQMGDNGIWVVVIMLVVFYAGWWMLYQRSKRNRK